MKILRSDNAKEYLDNNFDQFLEQNEILHQSSCVYTPQHNGIVEHNNKHLTDIANTLLFHRHAKRILG